MNGIIAIRDQFSSALPKRVCGAQLVGADKPSGIVIAETGEMDAFIIIELVKEDNGEASCQSPENAQARENAVRVYGLSR